VLERSFAHAYETGGMRRTHLRGHRNILKRLLIHLGAFNLSLMMRQRTQASTERHTLSCERPIKRIADVDDHPLQPERVAQKCVANVRTVE
jgi:hypothetical protein